MKKLWFLALLAVLLALAGRLFWSGERPPQRAVQGLPWQIELLPEGRSRVFGLTLPQTSLDQAWKQLGPDLELAVIAQNGAAGSLEAYADRFTAGVLTGKLVLSFSLDPEALLRLQADAVRRRPTGSGAWRYVLDPRHPGAARDGQLQDITFIPTAHFDAATALERFGTPAERIPGNDGGDHWLYPDLGLDLILSEQGREVLQYVAPRDFERLRKPLVQASEGAGP